MIVKKGNKYAVVSKSGKEMGEYDSKAEATKRLKQIEYFKMKAKKKYGYGGKLEYKKGGKLGKRKALDFNKDGKITKEDFAMLRMVAKKKKK